MYGLRRFAPIALLAALRASVPAVAFADPPRPSGATNAATNQSQDLIARGQALFDDQRYQESIQTLSGALVRPNNAKDEKLEIYRLLALDYITLSRTEEAEGAVRGLLALDPTYELPQRESPRFRDFFAAAKQKWEAEGRPGLVKETVAPPAPVTMKHASPSKGKPHTQIDLTATLDDPQSRITAVKLFYRAGSSGTFEETEASLDGAHVSGRIPPDAVIPPIVEYYLQGLDKGGMPDRVARRRRRTAADRDPGRGARLGPPGRDRGRPPPSSRGGSSGGSRPEGSSTSRRRARQGRSRGAIPRSPP